MGGQVHGYDLGLAVFVGRKVSCLRFGRARRQVIFFVAGGASYVKTLGVGHARLTLQIGHIIHFPLVVFLEHRGVNNVFAHKNLFGGLHNLVLAVASEHNNIVDVRAIHHVLVFFEAVAHKTVLAVHVQFLVGNGHYIGRNRVEGADFGEAFAAFAVFF